MEQGKLTFSPRNILIHEVVREINLFLSEQSKLKKIHLMNQTPEDMIVWADENMLKTVIRNLINNAIKFTRAGGSVCITAQKINEGVQVSVSDTGISISAENQSKLFKIDTSFSTRGTGNEKGTGLGLIICREFVEKHGGKIWVESELNKGSIFHFTLAAKNPAVWNFPK